MRKGNLRDCCGSGVLIAEINTFARVRNIYEFAFAGLSAKLETSSALKLNRNRPACECTATVRQSSALGVIIALRLRVGCGPADDTGFGGTISRPLPRNTYPCGQSNEISEGARRRMNADERARRDHPRCARLDDNLMHHSDCADRREHNRRIALASS